MEPSQPAAALLAEADLLLSDEVFAGAAAASGLDCAAADSGLDCAAAPVAVEPLLAPTRDGRTPPKL
jgi:hypothetical protein